MRIFVIDYHIDVLMDAQANPAVVSLQFNHHFPTGAPITFRDVAGMPQLNNRTCTLTALNATQFSIDVDTTGFGKFGGYGEVVEIKTSVFIKHVRCAACLQSGMVC